MAVSKMIPSLLVLVAFLSLVCALPHIESVQTTPLSTTSTTTITITGEGFGGSSLIEVVKIDGIVCDFVSHDDGVVICDAPAGLGAGRTLSLAADTLLTTTVDYNSASDASLCTKPLNDVIVDNAAAISVSICGENFGDSAIVAQPGWTGKFIVSVGAFFATVTYHDDGIIVFSPPAGGAGKQLPVKIVFGTQVVLIEGVTFTYPGPIVTAIKNIQGYKRAYIETERVAIFGRHFGTPSPSVHLTANVGGFACVNINHVSDSELHCTVTGYGANHEVIVTSNGQSSYSASSGSLGATGGSAVRYDFGNPVTPGMDCTPPNGAADIINSERCNCFSGYASLDPIMATECSVRAICPGRVTSVTSISQYPPSRPETTFSDDHLYIKQTMPIVKNRRDTIVQFVIPSIADNMMLPETAVAGNVGENTCFYPGTLWIKKVNDLDCLDEFYGVMPWTQNTMCGFVEDTHVDLYNRNYKTSLVTSYTETFKKSDGTLMYRKISNAYMIKVSFARKVTAITTPLSVIIADQNIAVSLQVAITSDALYDVATKQTMITFETTTVWPYQINDVTLVGTWTAAPGNTDSAPDATAVLSSVQSGDMVCDTVQDTDCVQSWIMTVNTEEFGTCNFEGMFAFPTQDLLCRDLTTNQTAVHCLQSPSTTFSITFGKTDLCDDSEELDATAGMTNSLDPYFDSALSVPQNVFQTGDMIYFRLVIVDPISSIDKITFHSIVLNNADATQHDTLLSIEHPEQEVTGANFNATSEVNSLVAPGQQAVLSFQFRLSRAALTVVNALSSQEADDLTKQITIEAIVDLFYHGNQKRSLIAASGPVPSVSHSQISFYDLTQQNEVMADDVVNESPIEEEILSIFESSASRVAATAVTLVVAALLLA